MMGLLRLKLRGQRSSNDSYFTADMSDSPLYGFNSDLTEGGITAGSFTRTHNTTGGPSDGPYVRIAYTSGYSWGGNVQHYVGYARTSITGWTPTAGTPIFWRMWTRFNNCEGSQWSAKFSMLGDQGGNEAHQRVILSSRDNGTSASTQILELMRNIDGGDHATSRIDITSLENTWIRIQCKALPSTLGSAITISSSTPQTGDRTRIVTASAHGLVDGDEVEIFNHSESSLNRTWGGPLGTPPDLDVVNSTTFDIQLDYTSSGGTGGTMRKLNADGKVSLWINNTTEGTPTDESELMPLSVRGWGQGFGWGQFATSENDPTAAPLPAIDLGGFEVGPTFRSDF